MVERREFRRHKILGEMEVLSVLGAGTVPERRPTVLDCSLGGARLRVHSPARRLFRAVPPCLHVRDSMTCVLRVDKAEVEVFAEVVRVKRLEEEPDSLDVGVRFFQDSDRQSYSERPMAKLARVLEPDRSEEEAAALAAKAVAARARGPAAATPPRPLPALPPASRPAAAPSKTSARVEKTSARLPSQAASRTSARVASPAPSRTSARVASPAPSRTSARVASPAPSRTSGRVASPAPSKTSARVASPAPSRTSARVAAQPPSKTSARLALTEPSSPPPARGVTTLPIIVQSSDSDVVAWAAARLSAPAGAGAHVATALDEVSERGSARLVAGAATVALSTAFTAAVREAGLTVHVTPTEECRGLFVAERTPARIVVRELGGGRSGASFDYLVIGTRRPLS